MHKINKIKKKVSRLVDNYYTRLLLKDIKPIDMSNSRYFFIFNHTISKIIGKLYLLVSHELSKHGIASCFQYEDHLWGSYSPKFSINGYEISNTFISENRFCIKPLSGQQLFFKWHIDIENKMIKAQGINFFPHINNTLRTIQKRYNVFFTDNDNRPVYDDLIQTCDLLLKHFLFLKNYAQKDQKRIRFVGFESEYVPNGILKMLCDIFSYNRDIEYIELTEGYKYYFGQHRANESFICSNLTRSGTEAALAISKQEWSRKDEKKVEFNKLVKPVSNALANETFYKIPTSQEKVIEKIENYRKEGRKIFVLFSHVFYDTPLDDASEAFAGMCEWIIETVRYFYGKENLLLLKPHPAEFLIEQPKRTPNETLASFLRDIELPDNILLLDIHQFTSKALSPFISCGLIWRSSVAMELTFLGIPCIIAGKPIYRVLNLNYSESKEHYFNMIEQCHLIDVSDRHKEDVALYLYMLDNKHLEIEHIAYDKVRKYHWKIKALKKYLKYGDEKIESLVENMLA